MFIIDTQGILRQITINDRSVGRSVPETMRLIRAFQHAEKLRETSSTKEFLEGEKYHQLLIVILACLSF